VIYLAAALTGAIWTNYV